MKYFAKVVLTRCVHAYLRLQIQLLEAELVPLLMQHTTAIVVAPWRVSTILNGNNEGQLHNITAQLNTMCKKLNSTQKKSESATMNCVMVSCQKHHCAESCRHLDLKYCNQHEMRMEGGPMERCRRSRSL